MAQWTADQLEYLLQFQHPEKMLRAMPGLRAEHVAAMFQIDLATYRRVRGRFARRARRAAAELLDGHACPARLPFRPGQVVVGLGDSITDDCQSWVEILRSVLALRSRRGGGVRVVNAGVSGDTTTQMITRFLDVVNLRPDWIVCLAGTNDARLHGRSPTKTLVSIEETERNYGMLRHYAATQTAARWVWMTPPTVIEQKISSHWFLGQFQLAWRNADLAAVAAAARRQKGPVVDLQGVFGRPAEEALLLEDGLHPSLAGQKAIVRALLERLA